jgi:peptidoglycan DL-endopeptidase CwlO
MVLLAALAALATATAVAVGGRGVTAIATAASGVPSAMPHASTPACPFPSSLRPAFARAARDTGLPPALLYAVGKVESNLSQDAESAAGARGLLQVMPATAKALDLDVGEANSNVLAGARYLRQMLNEFGTTDLALAAYNAGPTAVARAGGAPSEDVLRYVANVNLIWHTHSGCR